MTRAFLTPITTNAQITSTVSGAGAFRIVAGNYGVFDYSDGANYYKLLTNSADQNGSFNGLRPFYISLSTGLVSLGNGVAVANGASFGSATGASNTDFSKHISLFSTNYGLGITASRMNIGVPAASTIALMNGTTDIMTVGSAGAAVTGTLGVSGFTTLTSGNIGGAGQWFGSNTIYNAGWKYIATDFAWYFRSDAATGDVVSLNVAPSGTAGAAMTAVQAMVVSQAGAVGFPVSVSIGALTLTGGAPTGAGITALLAAPGPIGSTTPGSGVFSTLSANPSSTSTPAITFSGNGTVPISGFGAQFGFNGSGGGGETDLYNCYYSAGVGGFKFYQMTSVSTWSQILSIDKAGSLIAGAINTTPIGSTTPSTGAFTTLTASGTATIGTGGTTLSGAVLQATGTNASVIQAEIQNLSAATTASTDFVATANDGTDTTHFVNLGINSSTNTDPTFTIAGLHDGYLYMQSEDLMIGTATAGKTVTLFTGGTMAANARMTVSDTAVSLTEGMNFGSGVAAAVNDYTRHIALWGTTYGLSITANRLNIGTQTGTTLAMMVGATDIVTATSTGASVTGTLAATGALTGASLTTTGNINGTGGNVHSNNGRNLIHNAMMRVWQRGVGPFTTNGGYAADRWQQWFTNGTLSTSPYTLADADRSQIGDELPRTAIQVAVAGTAGAGDYAQLIQRLEDVRRTAGKSVTLSFWARATSGTPKLGVELAQIFGTGGSPSTTVTGIGSQSFTLSTSFVRYSATIAVPSVSGKTFGTTAGTDTLNLNFWLSSGATYNTRAGSIGVQSYTLQLWGVQIDVGTQATSLDKPDYALELVNCQRFYLVLPSVIISGYAPAAGNLYGDFTYPVTMRATPSISFGTFAYTNASGILTNAGYSSHVRLQVTATALGAAWGQGDAILTADF